MTPEEIEFILSDTQDKGVNIVRGCMQKGASHWKALFDGGLVEILEKDQHLRRALAQDMIMCRCPDTLAEILESYLSKITPARQKKFFTTKASSIDYSILHEAIEFSTTKSAKVIIEKAQKYGADFNLKVKWKMKYQSDKNVISGIANCVWEDKVAGLAEYIRLGIPFDDVAIARLREKFTQGNQTHLVAMLVLAIEQGGVSPDKFTDMIKEKNCHTGAATVLHACIAKLKMSAVISQKKAARP